MDKKTIRLGPDEGCSLRVFGELVTRKVTANRTGGAYSLFEAASQSGGGPPPHVQHREEECFYVLDGEFEFLVGNGFFGAGPGSPLYVPKGVLHAHKNVGETTGRLLVSQTPGGLYERFLEEIGAPATEGKPEAGTLAAVAARYGMEVAAVSP